MWPEPTARLRTRVCLATVSSKSSAKEGRSQSRSSQTSRSLISTISCTPYIKHSVCRSIRTPERRSRLQRSATCMLYLTRLLRNRILQIQKTIQLQKIAISILLGHSKNPYEHIPHEILNCCRTPIAKHLLLKLLVWRVSDHEWTF